MTEDRRLSKSSAQISDRNGRAAGRRAGESINIGGNAALGRGNLALGSGK